MSNRFAIGLSIVAIVLSVMPWIVFHWDKSLESSFVRISIAYLLGSWFGLIRMLFSAITPARILLGVPISFFSGAWLVVVTRMLFERIGGP